MDLPDQHIDLELPIPTIQCEIEDNFMDGGQMSIEPQAPHTSVELDSEINLECHKDDELMINLIEERKQKAKMAQNIRMEDGGVAGDGNEGEFGTDHHTDREQIISQKRAKMVPGIIDPIGI